MARYIDAEKLKERLEKVSVVTDDLYGMGINRGLDRAETEIDMFLTADVEEVRHGEWIEPTMQECFDGIAVLTCSKCSFKHTLQDDCGYSPIWHYCPNCGAKMDGRSDT